MRGNSRGGRVNGINRGSERNRGSGGGRGISTVYISIKWDITGPITDPTASDNVESGRTLLSAIGCVSTTLNASSFKGYGASTSKTRIETGYVIVVSQVVVVVAASALYPPSPSVAVQRGSGLWSLILLVLMVATFMSPPTSSKFSTTKVLRLPDVVAFGPISTSRTTLTRITVSLFAP